MNMLNMTTLSYFTGEQHSENFEQIIQLSEELGYSTRVYESKESNQFDFLQAVYRDTAIIVDATIPDDMSLSTVYTLLTAHVNVLDNVLVFSDKKYEDGKIILPMNITPLRFINSEEHDLLKWIIEQLSDLKEHRFYERFNIDSLETLIDFKNQMESIISASIILHTSKKGKQKQVMISYRNSCWKEVEIFKKQESSIRQVEIKMLPPGSICDEDEALSPMRRWMLVGLLENFISDVDEVWVYYNNIYTNSWWTIAEMVMVAYINYEREEKKKIKLKVYDAKNKRFIDEYEDEYPTHLNILLSDKQHQKLARYLANTRPDVIMDSQMQQSINDLKKMAKVMWFIPKRLRSKIIEQMRPIIEENVPSDFHDDKRNEMVNDVMAMYKDPKAIMAYTNEAVFKEDFYSWSNISYQVDVVTAAFKNGYIDVDAFMNTPMQELNKFKVNELSRAINKNLHINLNGKLFNIKYGKKRYVWLPTRMGKPTVKDAPGLVYFQTYNMHPCNVINDLQ